MILKRVRVEGKWIEYWFENPWGRFEACSKNYMLGRLIEEAGLQDYVNNYGLVGLDLELNERGEPKRLSVPGALGGNGFEAEDDPRDQG